MRCSCARGYGSRWRVGVGGVNNAIIVVLQEQKISDLNALDILISKNGKISVVFRSSLTGSGCDDASTAFSCMYHCQQHSGTCM